GAWTRTNLARPDGGCRWELRVPRFRSRARAGMPRRTRTVTLGFFRVDRVPSMARRRNPVPYCLALAAIVSASAARAAPIAFTYEAPSECPTRVELVAAIERQLGPDANAPQRAEVPITLQVSRESSGRYRVTLTHAGPGVAERTLEASTCAAVVDAAAVLIAMAF